MLERIKTFIKYKSVKIDGEDGPTVVMYAREFSKPVITKKKVILFIMAVVLIILIIQSIFAVYVTESFFSKNGSKKFVETVYGESAFNENEFNDSFLKNTSELIETKFDEKTVSAISIKNENVSSSYIILCHGYGANPYSMTTFAEHFYDLGFNILIPELTTAKENREKSVLLGTADVTAIEFWINYIIEKNEDTRILLFGVSTGAATITEAAAKKLPENVKSVIADSCYSSLWDFYEPYLENAYGISTFPVRNFASLYSKMKYGVSLKDVGPYSIAKDIEIPILFMYGENDIIVPINDNNDLYVECESKDKKQYVINEAEHIKLVEKEPESYWEYIDKFILESIGK